MTATVLERRRHRAPLGVRLLDAMTGLPVRDGVDVRVVALGPTPARPVDAFRTPSGVYAIRDLPGRRDDDPPRPHRIEVRDRTGAFLSFALTVDLPAGLLADPCAGPPVGSPPALEDRALPLFSRPSRAVPGGMAAVRARLAHAGTLEPAAYAMLEVTPAPGLDPVRGIADERGEVLVAFPYPQPPGLVGSPPSGVRRPLARTTWPVTVTASLPVLAPVGPGDELPDLCALQDQSPTTLTTTASPIEELGEGTIEHGRELVLRSSPSDATLLVGA